MVSDWSVHAFSQLVAIWGAAARLHGSFGHVPSDSSLQLVQLPYKHFLILPGSDFRCHSNGVLHSSIKVLRGNLFRHLLVILLLNWAGYKLDTTVSCMDHIAWTMLHSSTQNKAHLTGISHRKEDSQIDGIWSKFPRLRSWSRSGDQLRDCVGALAMCHQTLLCSLYTYWIGTSLYHQDRIFDAIPMMYFIVG